MRPAMRNFAIKVTLAFVFPILCLEGTAQMIMYQTGKNRRHALHDMFEYMDSEAKRILPTTWDNSKDSK